MFLFLVKVIYFTYVSHGKKEIYEISKKCGDVNTRDIGNIIKMLEKGFKENSLFVPIDEQNQVFS